MVNSLFFHLKISCLFISVLFLLLSNNLGAAVLIPSVTGPIQVTADSYPFCATNKQDLNKFGYVEEEYFVSGKANVYGFDKSGKVVVVTPDAPYTTRILIRRPMSKNDFSGNVIVELMNPTASFDTDLIWALCNEYFITKKDIWIGVTAKPVAAKSLKKFNPERYAPLSWANPVSPDKTCTPRPSRLMDTIKETENGLIWDIVSQVGALVRDNRKGNPISEYKVERVYAAGYSQTSFYLVTYINFIRPLSYSVFNNGSPVYDGYMLGDGDGFMTSLNQCSKSYEPDDPRVIIAPRPEPVINIVSQSHLGYSTKVRRPDSDSPDDRYRSYEIPGASHDIKKMNMFFTTPENLAKLGFPPLEINCLEIKKYGKNDFPLEYLMNGAFANLDAWVKSGIKPPKAPRIIINESFENPFYAAKLDKYGNALGGLRTPYLDVPVATYFTSSTSPGDEIHDSVCPISGYKKPFEKEQIKSLYKTRDEYLSKVNTMVDSMVKERFIIKEDGEKIKKQAEEVKAWED